MKNVQYKTYVYKLSYSWWTYEFRNM